MPTYYNEIDPYAAQWLRNLIAKQLITAGEVDERPIQDVRPADLIQFTRCHFFAGIAGWDIALRQANYPTDKQVWTGSCPCQPFSTAGKREQFTDERHLWPFWFHLISVCRPPVILGEQVANGSGLWLDLVLADLESADYAVGAAVLPACSVGASHERQRIWFVADSNAKAESVLPKHAEVGATSRIASDIDAPRLQGWGEAGENGTYAAGIVARCGFGVDVARVVPREHWAYKPVVGRGVHGISARMERVCAYGNAVVPQVAAEFIKAYLACRP